jgi:hypothetical protein
MLTRSKGFCFAAQSRQNATYRQHTSLAMQHRQSLRPEKTHRSKQLNHRGLLKVAVVQKALMLYALIFRLVVFGYPYHMVFAFPNAVT